MTESDQTTVEDLSPSGKLVYTVLDYGGAQTQKEIIEESMLSARTVRYALNDLQEAGIVTDRVYLPDARQRLYELAEESEEADAPTAEAAAGRTRNTRASHTDD